VLVGPTNTCLVRHVATSPTFSSIVAAPVQVVCLVPATIVVGQRVEVFLKSEDRWWNPTPAPALNELELRW